MPVPTPSDPEMLGSCIRALRREGYSDNKQRVAICMAKYRKAHGIKEPPKEKK